MLRIAEVAQLQQRPPVAVEQGVFQFDVPVFHPHAVAVIERYNQLMKEPASLPLLQTC